MFFPHGLFPKFLLQLDRTVDQIIANPYRGARLKYPPLDGFYKRKFFSMSRPKSYDRPDMRLIYWWDAKKRLFKFLCVGRRVIDKPYHQYDVYQQAKLRDLYNWQ
ncbi:MAG: hypothetical protein RLZ12_927 [Bacillota bacterium]|jgi:hypothetical protein